MVVCSRNSLLGYTFLLAWWCSTACAHDPRPITVSISAPTKDWVRLEWRTPDSVPSDAVPAIATEGDCQTSAQTPLLSAEGEWRSRVDLKCVEEGSLRAIELRFPLGNPSLTTVILDERGDVTRRALLEPGTTRYVIGDKSAAPAARGYWRLGALHIWSGIDHLLFLMALLLIARTPRRLLGAITGFTLGHSMTLAAAVSGWIPFSVRYVEATIALSLVWIAAELLRKDRSTLTWRHPVVVATLFGFLHGFGFANVLREVGWSADEFALSLLMFNVGIEVGQLAFVAALTGCFYVVTKNAPHPAQTLRLVTTVCGGIVGVAGSYWFVERSAAMLGLV